MRKKQPKDSQLGKLASDCADKLRGVENFIPEAPTITTRKSRAATPIINNFDIHFEQTDHWYDEMLGVAGVVGLVVGFIFVGMFIAEAMR